jgi:hypothetical protein
LGQLTDKKFNLTSTDLRDNVLQFYSDLSAPMETKKDPGRWQSELTSLDQLKVRTPVPAAAENPRENLPSVHSEAITKPVAGSLANCYTDSSMTHLRGNEVSREDRPV